MPNGARAGLTASACGTRNTPPTSRMTASILERLLGGMHFSQIVELRGHIIDWYALPQIMDEVMDRGGEFVIQDIQVGRRKDEPSYARIQISAPNRELLELLLNRAQRIGATPEDVEQVNLVPAPADGVFPEGFYSTTNLETAVRLAGNWVQVEWPEMDCGIAVDEA